MTFEAEEEGNEFPLATTEPPPDDIADNYRQFADDFWLAIDWYSELVEDDVSVAHVSSMGDRPGGAEDGWIDRHGDHYIFWLLGSDIWEYIGKFETTAEAVEAYSTAFSGLNQTINLKIENWVGPVRSD